MKKRVLLLVIDGLGVGEMDDVHDTRPHDIGSHTLNSIRKFNHSDLSNLANLNLFDLDHPKCLGLNGFNMMIGKSCLGYPGADSYLGHRTIIGNKVNVRPTFVEKIFPIIKEKFSPEFDVTLEDNVICLDRSIFISNNVETDLGLNINVLL